MAALAWLYYDSMLSVPFLLPLLIVWHREWEQSRMEKEKEQFRMQFREWILLLSSSLTAGYSVENAFGQSLRELKLMFPGGGAMLEALQEMVLRAENNQRPESAAEGSGRKASVGRSREFCGSILYGKNKRWKPEYNYPADSRADGTGDGYQKGDPDISGGKNI